VVCCTFLNMVMVGLIVTVARRLKAGLIVTVARRLKAGLIMTVASGMVLVMVGLSMFNIGIILRL
jgi:hypothetical protein